MAPINESQLGNSLTVLIGAVLCFAGCVGSMVETGEASVVTPDGGNTACVPQEAASGDGHHKPGTACLECHKAGGDGPTFTIGGTVYDGLGSDTPMVGVAVRLTDADRVEITMITAENGNFWTNQAIAFPLTTSTSNCPDIHPMLTAVDSSGADCNTAGCHVAGFRVYTQ